MPWCTQCYAALRAGGGAESSGAPRAAAADAQEDEAVAAPAPACDAAQADPGWAGPVRATWPCTACGRANELGEPACGGCGAGFLAPLRGGERPALVLPVVGDVAALDRAAAAGLAVGAVLVAVLLTWLLGGLLP